MEADYRSFNFQASRDRIDAILDAPSGTFEEADSLPDRSKLTYTNGFYANCSAVFIDIRDSSGLTSHYKRPRLARIYRSFISEMVAAFSDHTRVREINIVGDCVWAVVNTPLRSQIDELFTVACTAHSIVDVLNVKLKKRDYDRTLAVGVGLDYGRALMVKAGYSGSGINEVVYMGDVVNSAAHLASQAHSAQWGRKAIHLSSGFYSNLNEHNQGLCEQYNYSHYKSSAVMTYMNDWVEEQ
ncbi:adenylate/guanylate cyclase domain-containing protein [Demequina sp. SO4-18]|uniref:adenylate/guanylate cyclase domain-containing protein n=1 Tax=Demequina sp. SO4-18 TaxID=3401026 RepID=UPI003B5941FD